MDIVVLWKSIITQWAFGSGTAILLAVTGVWGWQAYRIYKQFKRENKPGRELSFSEPLKLHGVLLAILGFLLIGAYVTTTTFGPRLVIDEPNRARQDYLKRLDAPAEIIPMKTEREILIEGLPNTRQELDDAIGRFRESTKELE